jgi:hypothetical protein
MAGPSLTTLLQQRANQQPGGTAYTFIDYDVDQAGVAQSLTWAQLHRRARRLGAGLAAMLPGLPSVDVNDADGFSAAMRTALDVDGPSVVSIECAADEIPPFATLLEPSVAKNLVCQDITQENRTDVALSV